MNLSYSAEYEQFRAEVRRFLAEHWTPEDAAATVSDPSSVATLGGAVRTDSRATTFRLKAIERGYLYRHVPRRYGGSEQPPDPLKAAIIGEEFRQAKAPGEVVGQGPSMLVPTLLEHGTEAQKEDASRPGRRPLGSERAEDLDVECAGLRLDVRVGSHRAGQAEARRDQLPADRHADTRPRRQAPPPDDGRRGLQRGLLRQRARTGRESGGTARSGMGGEPLDPQARARADRWFAPHPARLRRTRDAGAGARPPRAARHQGSNHPEPPRRARGTAPGQRVPGLPPPHHERTW